MTVFEEDNARGRNQDPITFVSHHWPLPHISPWTPHGGRAQFLKLEPTVFPSPLVENKSHLSISSKLCLCIFFFFFGFGGLRRPRFWLATLFDVSQPNHSIYLVVWFIFSGRCFLEDPNMWCTALHTLCPLLSVHPLIPWFLLSPICQCFFLLGPDKPSKTLPLPMYSYLRPLLWVFFVPSSASCHGILACLVHQTCAITLSKPPRASLAMC